MYEEKITIDQTNQEAVWILQPHSNLPKEKEAFKKEAKRRAKIQSTPNPYDFESRIWQLTYNMGAQILNRSELHNESKFWITGTKQNTQQIDVFAVVRDYALIIECTTSISKENILVAGSLPPQNGTYVVDEREINIIKKDFKEQAEIIKPYVDFFYLDVISSAKEVEAACEVTEKMNMPVLVGLHLKKNGKIASGETVTEIVKKYKTSNWIGLIGACVSLEIIENSSKEMSDLDIPFGFKANLWNVEEPLPLHKFNRSKFNEVGKNPNDTMGRRDEITGEIFYNFAKRIKEKGANILGGCCNINPEHIKSISSLK